MNKISIELTRSELQALFQLLSRIDWQLIEPVDMRIMARVFGEKLFFKVQKKLLKQEFKPVKLNMQPAEAAALRQVLCTFDLLAMPVFDANLAHRLFLTIDQKLLNN